jgi:hypothetical protein
MTSPQRPLVPPPLLTTSLSRRACWRAIDRQERAALIRCKRSMFAAEVAGALARRRRSCRAAARGRPESKELSAVRALSVKIP